MNPARDSRGRAEDLRPVQDDLAEVQSAEGRSWEPPCWPSDGWDSPAQPRRRAIGWRGSRGN